MSLPYQTFTDPETSFYPNKEILCKKYVGKKLNELRTAGCVINKDVFEKNCLAMTERIKSLGPDIKFRAHLKSHKTAEGSRMQLHDSGSCVVSTLREAWGCVESGLVKEGFVKEIAYGFPLPLNVIKDLDNLRQHVPVLVFIDHVAQIDALESTESSKDESKRQPWRVFLKCDSGSTRAGVSGSSGEMKALIESISTKKYVIIHGVYTHAGESYASRTEDDASSYLAKEINSVADGGEQVVSQLGSKLGHKIVLSVGSTPTAHVSATKGSTLAKAIERARGIGILEIHAGNYPLLDLQQVATSLAPADKVAISVLARVVSEYPHRSPPQALIDAGGIAFSKDLGPISGYGNIVSPDNLRGYQVTKVSQEHGIIQWKSDGQPPPVEIGTVTRILPQHACMTAAAYPFYYIIDDAHPDQVVDVWVPWKNW